LTEQQLPPPSPPPPSRHPALPADYRQFMTTFAGESPEQRSFKLTRDDERELNALWPLKGRCGSVPGGWGLLTGEEAHLLVIGDDGGGNWITLAIAGADRGKVFFIDQDYSPGERKRVIKLAKNFAEFMGKISGTSA
jgi:hypothetical protein